MRSGSRAKKHRRSAETLTFPVLCGVFLLVLEGCAVGPDYHKPQMDAPATWSTPAPENAAPAGTAEVTHWWTLFNDPELTSLIESAEAGNTDLKLAETRIRESRAERRVLASEAAPSVDASGSLKRSHNSENGSTSRPKNLFQAGFDASWEIDVFGAVRRAVEQADATVEAAEEDRRDVLVVLLAEVAKNYMEVRGTQLRLDIANRNIESQTQTLELARARFAAGLSASLEVAQAEAQLATTQSKPPLLESSLQQSIHRLGVLLGFQPETLLEELSSAKPMPADPPEVPIGIPSDILRRRPDIRRAERQLAAATAGIGVATAELFPRFSITAALGLQSKGPATFLRPDSHFWTIGPDMTWPIFNAGKIRAKIEIKNIQQEQAFIQYQKTILDSLEDVENALTAYSKQKASLEAASRAVKANERAYEIAEELYSRGLVDFLNVLDAMRSMQQAQDQEAETEQAVRTNLVALFKALGGGWELEDES